MAPKSTSKKRKSDAQASDAAGPSTKKARTANDPPHLTAALVGTILASKQAYALPEDEDETKKVVVLLAEYARGLEVELELCSESLRGTTSDSTSANLKKSEEELRAAAAKIKKSTHSGICKQMTWKPSCKNGSARFVYDGVCADPEVFGALLGLDGPPTWKMKKLTVVEFESRFGQCVGKARFNSLYITGQTVNLRYSAEGEFKISGTYGTYAHRLAAQD